MALDRPGLDKGKNSEGALSNVAHEQNNRLPLGKQEIPALDEGSTGRRN